MPVFTRFVRRNISSLFTNCRTPIYTAAAIFSLHKSCILGSTHHNAQQGLFWLKTCAVEKEENPAKVQNEQQRSVGYLRGAICNLVEEDSPRSLEADLFCCGDFWSAVAAHDWIPQNAPVSNSSTCHAHNSSHSYACRRYLMTELPAAKNTGCVRLRTAVNMSTTCSYFPFPFPYQRGRQGQREEEKVPTAQQRGCEEAWAASLPSCLTRMIVLPSSIDSKPVYSIQVRC